MKEWRVYYFLLDGRGKSYQAFSTKKNAQDFIKNIKNSAYLKNIKLVEHTTNINKV